MPVFVALLRGVNVGGNNIISMKSLKTSFEQLGFSDVSTYINSGNILFKAKERHARKLETNRSDAVERTQAWLQSSCTKLPGNGKPDREFAERLEWRQRVEVQRDFLRHSIDSEKVLEGLGPKPEIEKVVYYPGTLLWSARISDFSRTTMQKLSSQKLFQDMTVRNTNTTRKLYELMKKMSED